MKRTVQIAAVCLLLLLLPLTAMAAEQEDLPIEYVSYGYGLPDPAPVPSHGLTDQNLTLEGIRYETGLEGERIYIRLADLAAAKLLRESGARAAELGLDYEKLMISEGKLLPRRELSAQEQQTVQEQIAQLTASARVGVTGDDLFELANGGVGKLLVRLAGYVLPPEEPTQSGESQGSGAENPEPTPEPTTEPEPEPTTEPTPPEPETAKIGVVGKKAPTKEYASAYTSEGTQSEGAYDLIRQEVTTIYIFFEGSTYYQTSGPNITSMEEVPEEQPEDVQEYRDYSLYVGISYSEKDLAEGVKYYITIVNDSGNGEEIVRYPDGTPASEMTFSPEDASDQDMWNALDDNKIAGAYQSGPEKRTLPTIRVSTDAEGKNVVKTIHFQDETPALDKITDKTENGYELKDTLPEDYTVEKQWGNITLEPDSMVSVPAGAEDTENVTITVRDTVATDIWNRPSIGPLSAEEEPEPVCDTEEPVEEETTVPVTEETPILEETEAE